LTLDGLESCAAKAKNGGRIAETACSPGVSAQGRDVAFVQKREELNRRRPLAGKPNRR
jgi:hypothetical protein